MNAFAHNAFGKRGAFASAFGGGGGGGLPFPTVTTGTLILRLMGSNITGVADGDPVSLWPDSSGLSHDATPGSAPEQPEFVAASANFNGQPTVIFDGVDDGMLVDSGCVLETPYTLFMVAKALGAAAGSGRMIQSQDANNLLTFNVTDYSAFVAPDLVQNSSTTVPGSSPAIACLVNGALVYNYYINTETPFANTTLSDWGRIGLNGAGAFSQYIAAEMAAVIAFDGALDETDRLAVSAYLDTLYFGGLLGFA